MKTFVDIYKKVIIGSPKQKYAFLDRDGTLIFEPQDDFQVDSLKKLKLLDGVIEGLQSLQNKDYRLVIVSNQDGAGTPSFPRAGFEAPHNAMLEKFKASGINFDQVFICVHLKEDNCGCRKPKTGLLDDWLEGVTIDSDESFVCGDRENDKNLAKNLGLKFVPMTTNDNFLLAITEEILL